MSKKINSALKDLKKALNKHADALGGSAVSLKKAQRATAKLAEAATAYAEAVSAKSGMENPFTSAAVVGLDAATLASLAAERDAIKKSRTSPIEVQKK